MKYEIIADASNWPKPKAGNIMPVLDSAACIGSIKIEFLHKGKAIVDKRDYIEIPLFLAAFEDFLARVNSKSPQHWSLGFAPFAHGLLQNGSLLISSLGGEAFGSRVYDTTSKEDLQRLRAQVTGDISRFGKLQMDRNRESKIVTDF
jgi:hypothetical protein